MKKERLEQYLSRRGEPQVRFAKRSGVPQSILSRVCLGGDTSGKRWAQIMAATGNRVTPQAHFPAGRR